MVNENALNWIVIKDLFNKTEHANQRHISMLWGRGGVAFVSIEINISVIFLLHVAIIEIEKLWKKINEKLNLILVDGHLYEILLLQIY